MSLTTFLDNFAPGGDPFATRLILGDFEFTGLEVPESVSPGAGKQQLVIHKMVGGKRKVDVLGVDYDNLSWSGWIIGATAGDRVSELETMRDVGAPLTFSMDGYYYSVVIQSFTPRFEHVYRRPYTIELVVVSSLDTPVTENALAGTLDSLINSDVGESLGLASIINSSSVSSAIDTVKSAVSQVQGFANATIDTVQTVIRPLVAAQAVVQSVIAQVGASVNDITTLGGLVPGNPVAQAANNVLRQGAALTQLAPLYQMQSVLDRMQKNVLSGPLANGTSSVTTSNSSLQKVAADAYGDQSRWTEIAAANSITDPRLDGIQTIKIPVGE
ncbi:hypothetical protein C8K66_10291 [Pseudomonas sp. GV105]|uniref:hypothetical protein n=1 Tax=Pseudomonas sp. GV105 TaxID=2135759 RepID=UPI000D3B36EA|nr:hypothetical protein [Pseudomonas sp. GV105]PUB36612.1 hypothetical protein C8K66_10291 [Pseudomonas sp. GV105]